MFNKLKQFKDVRDKAKHLQAELGKESTEGSAGWGKVKVTLNGNQQATAVSIDPSVMDDKAKLEEMVKDAINDGMKKLQQMMATKMKDMGGLDFAKELQEMMGSEKK